MRIDRFTAKMQEALQESQTLASGFQQQEITAEHLLLALLRQPDGLARPILEQLNVDVQSIENQLEAALVQRPKVTGGAVDQYLGNELRSLLNEAETEMSRLKDEYVSVEHVLLALAESKGKAGDILRTAGATRAKLMQAL